MPFSLMGISSFSFALSLLFFNSLTLISSSTIFNFTTDQHALLTFQNTITDPNGFLRQNWSTHTSFCYWIGVSCGPKHRRVTALNVSGFELRGSIAPHLGNLTFLRSLDLSKNNFTGSIPAQLSNLRRLKEINLASNQITGSIPNGLFLISSLIEINTGHNLLSGTIPSNICSNTTAKLEKIYIEENQLHGQIPVNIYKCRELVDLRLANNSFSGNIPSEIGNLTNLEMLYLSINNFSGNIPSSIFNMSSLRFIYLGENSLYGSIAGDSFLNLLKIEEIFLYGNNLTGSIPKEIVNITSLTWLDFGENKLTGELPQELDNLPNLQGFDASFNDISGFIPPSIFNISSLTELYLQQNLLSGTLPPSMGLSLPKLQILCLFFNKLTGEIPNSIANATKLTKLELNRNSFSGSIPNFGNLEQLQYLRLWENRLTGAKSPDQELEFLSSLTNCRNLEVIEVTENPLNGILPASIGNLSTTLVRFLAWNCSIRGGIPPQIGNLYNLQALFLSENHLTGVIPATIGKLKQLGEVQLGGNRLQGYIPTEFCQMSNLGVLDLSVNMLTGPIHECFGEVRSLRDLSFSSNMLNSTLPAKFWELSDLVTLDLSSNYLTGQVSPQIGTWKINDLDLSSNMFSGDIPSTIGECQSLEFLSLSNNKFEGSIPEALGKVRGLRSLNLSNNSLSGLIPKSLEELIGLEYLSVSYNKLEGEIPDGGRFGVFNATSFVHNSDLCGAARFQVPPCKKNHGRSRKKVIAMIMKYIVPPFIATIIVVVVIVMAIRRRKQIKRPPLIVDPYEKIAWKRISYRELVQGTSSFSDANLLGKGSFGSVFKATLSDGLNIAVKVFNLQQEGATRSFDTESEILSSIRHRNLVPVIGCCSNPEFKALLLGYMINGSLETWLHSDGYNLDLVQRLKIAIDVALALEYLHHGHTFPVVHCDIKPSNILLDEDITAHVGDFGISKLLSEDDSMIQTKTLATIGYAAPEYGSEGKVSTKGDVYSYGILLLEMFTGKKPTDEMFGGEMSLKEWVADVLQEHGPSEVVAPGLLSTEDQHFSKQEQCVSSIFGLAMKCLVFSPEERINMTRVVAALHKIKAKVATVVEVNSLRSRR